MASWARPYLLKRRGGTNGSGYWYYRLRGEKTYHTTGEKTRARAEDFAVRRFRETERSQTAEDLLVGAEPVRTFGSLQEWARDVWEALEPRERIAVLYTFHRARCHYCGQGVHLARWRDTKSNERATIDHKIPLVGGGPDTFDNSVLACQKCNTAKNATSYKRFVLMQSRDD